MAFFQQIDIKKDAQKNICIDQVIPACLKTAGILSEFVDEKYDLDLEFDKDNVQTAISIENSASNNNENKPDKIVLILADALGAINLKNAQNYAPFLRKMRAKIISTCIPSTTTSAITTLTTSSMPSETNMLGWSIIDPKNKKLVKLLSFENCHLKPDIFQPTQTWFEILSDNMIESFFVGMSKFENSGFTSASFKASTFVSVNSHSEITDKIIFLNRKNAKFIYSHWAKIDQLGHRQGSENYFWDLEIESFDRFISELYSRLASKTLLIVVADHGMVNVDEENKIYLNDFKYYDCIENVAGEPRSLHVHLKNTLRIEEKEKILKHLELFLDDKAYVVTAKKPCICNKNIFENKAWEILGDCVIFAKKNYVIYDKKRHMPQMRAMKGVHGSITDEEMLIPCLYAFK